MWQPAECDLLRSLAETKGELSWNNVAYKLNVALGSQRTANNCEQRWNRV